MSHYRDEDISGAFRSDRPSDRGYSNRPRENHHGNNHHGNNVNSRKRSRTFSSAPNTQQREGPVDRTNTPPFLIRVFPYVVALDDICDADDAGDAADAPAGEGSRAKKPVGAAGLTKAYRPPDAYRFVFNPEEGLGDLEEIRVYTYADATLESVVDEIKEEMGKRGLLRDADAGSLGISVAAAWEEWHRNDEKFFMRCRSVGKVGMGESWAKATRADLGVDLRGFPDKRTSTLGSLNWKVGDAMDVCFLYA